MVETDTAAAYLDALASFEQASERLAAANPVMLSSPEVLDALRRLECAARKVPSSQHWLTEVGIEQGLHSQLGYTGAKEMLVDQLHLAGSEAQERIRGARSRAPRQEHGHAPGPVRAVLAAAQRKGLLSERHAVSIEKALDKCSRKLSLPKLHDLEDMLVTAAVGGCTPDDIAALGRRAYEHIDPDGAEPSSEDIARARELTVGKQGDDLMSALAGALSPEARALMDVVLEKLARPGVNNPDDADAPIDTDDADAVAAAAKRDRRTAAQRNHDALVAALRAVIASGALGQHRGLPCVPVITLDIDQLESETGIATTATGGRLPVEDALRMMGANPGTSCCWMWSDARCTSGGRSGSPRRISASRCTARRRGAVHRVAMHRPRAARSITSPSGRTAGAPTSTS
ncbi:hypothetical protein TPB0596_46140 [Tsukamurella pulmonis]|uniref:DUF222 domain-containing protein n=1 Tax=Tsukamurella pulmonis TaxID=47312 RepID=UPI001EDCDC8D|nr:DUF222 domain-containing protein [Tsukamurella pulmonis]BDD84851.1 hypothetical protein TPB0596_46140 [Tsukamurella pulmonis]